MICTQLSDDAEVSMSEEEGGVKVAGGGWVFKWSDLGRPCGRWCRRRCGSFGQPILNHQGFQHSDILENHICAGGGGGKTTHKHTLYTLPVIPPSPHAHKHTLKDTQNCPRRKLNCACFII